MTKVCRREVDLPGHWRRIGKRWARAIYSRRQRGYTASVFFCRAGFPDWDLQGQQPDMSTGTSVLGLYLTADAALDAAEALLGMSDDRLCTPADIDRARRERLRLSR